MTAVSVLLIVVGIFILINSPNLVGVIQGNKKLSFQGAAPVTNSPLTGTPDPRAGK